MPLSDNDLGKALQKYENRYKKRYRGEYVPVSINDLKEMHDYYKKSHGDSMLKSVWIDDVTILHLAYFIITHLEEQKRADGVRIYTEKFTKKTKVAGKTFEKDTVGLAFVVTYEDNEGIVPQHTDWMKPGLKAKIADEGAIDNYNDPDPPKSSGGSL